MRALDLATTCGAYYADALGHLALFQRVDFTTVADLIGACELISIHPGTVVVAEGTSNRAIYHVVSGRLQVTLRDVQSAPLAILEPGACFGELSILSGVAASADVTTIEPARLLVITEDILWALIARCHPFACNLFAVLAGRVRSANERLRTSLQAERLAERAARIDMLTGLYNRRGFDEALARECQRCVARAHPLWLLMLDIDHFKRVNDTHGHLIGDEVLRILALRLANATRASGVPARFGGEELAVLLPGLGRESVCRMAEDFRGAVADSQIATSRGRLSITVSIGISELGCEGSPRALLAAADAALYAAKAAGRNRVVLADATATAH